jgi:hypothetical protein
MTLWAALFFSQRIRASVFFQGRNFALNPRQGLKISAFKDAHTPRAMADRELDDLAKYLLHVASIEDMETLNHKVVLQSHGDLIV